MVVESDLAGRLLLRGRGAGADAAASAVLSDLVAVARARRQGREVTLPPASPVPSSTPRPRGAVPGCGSGCGWQAAGPR